MNKILFEINKYKINIFFNLIFIYTILNKKIDEKEFYNMTFKIKFI